MTCVDASPGHGNTSDASPGHGNTSDACPGEGNTSDASAVPVAANAESGPAKARPDAASWANVRMIESGSQLAVGWRRPTAASRPLAVGRWLGSLTRQYSRKGRSAAGT